MDEESQVRGKGGKYLLGERSIKINKSFSVREVRRLWDDGHQTSIITTRQNLTGEQIARRMFFRYMREEYALDHLVTHEVEPADVERLVPNPAKKEKRKLTQGLKGKLEKLKMEYGDKALQNDGTRHLNKRDFDIANLGCKEKILQLEKEIEQSKRDLKQIPDQFAIK